MAYKPQKVQKVMVQPINLIFRYLQNRSRVQVWLYENINLRIEGHIVGFDEYMNLVLDDAEEYYVKSKNRRQLGRIMLKGDNITLIQNVNPQSGNWFEICFKIQSLILHYLGTFNLENLFKHSYMITLYNNMNPSISWIKSILLEVCFFF
jgi:small nuclear ribonucleoprotein E